jgi:hypothetical protein
MRYTHVTCNQRYYTQVSNEFDIRLNKGNIVGQSVDT